MLKRKLKIIILVIVGVLLIDQFFRFVAEAKIRYNRSYLEGVVERANLEPTLDEGQWPVGFQSCEIHHSMIVYESKTCFDRGAIHSKLPDIFIGLIFMPPKSLFASLFDSWWYYELNYTDLRLLAVSKDKKIIKFKEL